MRAYADVMVPALFSLAALCTIQGCLLIRTTEHRIKLNENGSGEAIMRLIDIRSDGKTDSARIRDYGVMMASADDAGLKDFERNGRIVTSKRFIVSGDTLSAEIAYTFPRLEALEGLNVRDDELFVVVNEGREIVRTNGKIRSWERNAKRIVWPRDAKRLLYEIRDKIMPPSVSLASQYAKFGHSDSGGNQ